MQNVVELLDELFHQAAFADEPPEHNYVRKHSQDMQAKVQLYVLAVLVVVSS